MEVVACDPGAPFEGKPLRFTVGDAGSATVRLRVAVAVWPVASVTVAMIENVPSADGVPVTAPVLGAMVSPPGSPVALQV